MAQLYRYATVVRWSEKDRLSSRVSYQVVRSPSIERCLDDVSVDRDDVPAAPLRLSCLILVYDNAAYHYLHWHDLAKVLLLPELALEK